MNEKPRGIWNPAWPGTRTAGLRLLVIAVVLVPLSWIIYALLIGSWRVTFGDEESIRHFVQWMVILLVAISVVFLASLLPALGGLYRFLHWLFSPRITRRLFVLLVWIVTAIVLFYTEENWRGARAWNRYRAEIEATGEQLDLAAYVPRAIPDEQNFAATPVVKSWFVEVDKTVFTNSTERFTNSWQDAFEKVNARLPEPSDKTNRHLTDLVAWGQGFDALRNGETNLPRESAPSGKFDTASRAAAAPSVLAGLKTDAATLAELQTASRRPLSRYPVLYDAENPWGVMLPHLINVRNACRRLSVRSCAELAAGRSDDALADVELTLYLADSVKDEPFLISYLVRIACIQMAIQPVWEGLAEHAWSDTQLRELQPLFQRYDLVADMKRPFDAERAAGVSTAAAISKKGFAFLIELVGPGQPTSLDKKFANWAGALIPSGWYYLEQVNFFKLYQLQREGVIDPAKKRISPARLQANQEKLSRELPAGGVGSTINNLLHHRLISAVLLSSLNRIPPKGAAAQTAVDQAALACALERYRLANRSFPETLAALEPKYISQLPADVITGNSFAYQRTADGQFQLDIPMWGEKDHPGAKSENIADSQFFRDQPRVWQYPSR